MRPLLPRSVCQCERDIFAMRRGVACEGGAAERSAECGSGINRRERRERREAWRDGATAGQIERGGEGGEKIGQRGGIESWRSRGGPRRSDDRHEAREAGHRAVDTKPWRQKRARRDAGLDDRKPITGGMPVPRGSSYFFAQASFSVIVRLNTSFPGALSLGSSEK